LKHFLAIVLLLQERVTRCICCTRHELGFLGSHPVSAKSLS